MAGRIPKSQPVRPGYLRAGRFLVFLYVIGVVLVAYIETEVRGQPLNFISLSYAFGGALPGVVLASLVILPWRLAERRLGRISGSPLFAGTLVWAVIMYLTYRGALMP